MVILKTSIVLFAITILSCCSTSKSTGDGTANGPSKEELLTANATMLDAGYQRATVIVSKITGDCPVTLLIAGETTTYLDPINMNDLDGAYKIHGTKVWVTYNGLRMMNRCDKALPISIVDIQKRAE